jgi:FMN-dependent oxidoreductase (nitrilotriacetate monooxygenase family)
MRQMVLVGFLQAQNCTNLASSWRHPQSRTDSWSPDFYRHIGRVLEAGKFHLGFFDDRLSMPDMYGRNHAHTVQHGIRCIKLDAVTVLTVMGMATERLGLGATYSTSYYEPFHVARLFATLDLMTGGRAAWNVVTSLNDGEAQNMGRDEVVGHDARYDRADEFMDIVLGHWDTWEDDAIVQDKASGLFAKPGKVHRLDYTGRYFRSRGPFTVPRSAQGHPVIIQAGSSGRGKTFGARWGEVIFVVYPNIEVGKRDYAAFKDEVARFKRDPGDVKITHLINTVVASTKSEAEDKWAEIKKLPLEIDALSLLSEALNFDLAKKGHGRTIQRRRVERNVRPARHPRSRDEREAKSHGARIHRDQRPRAGAQSNRRRTQRRRRSARSLVRRAGVRRVRAFRNACAGRLRRFCPFRDSGTAAPRSVPQRVRWRDAARESWTGQPCNRRMADAGIHLNFLSERVVKHHQSTG